MSYLDLEKLAYFKKRWESYSKETNSFPRDSETGCVSLISISRRVDSIFERIGRFCGSLERLSLMISDNLGNLEQNFFGNSPCLQFLIVVTTSMVVFIGWNSYNIIIPRL